MREFLIGAEKSATLRDALFSAQQIVAEAVIHCGGHT